MRHLTADEMAARVTHHFGGGLFYAKQVSIAKGEAWGTHAHPDTHMSVLAKGSVLLTVDGATTMHSAPDYIRIEKGKRHGVTALEDSEWFCVWATDETDPDKIDTAILGGNHAV